MESILLYWLHPSHQQLAQYLQNLSALVDGRIHQSTVTPQSLSAALAHASEFLNLFVFFPVRTANIFQHARNNSFSATCLIENLFQQIEEMKEPPTLSFWSVLVNLVSRFGYSHPSECKKIHPSVERKLLTWWVGPRIGKQLAHYWLHYPTSRSCTYYIERKAFSACLLHTISFFSTEGNKSNMLDQSTPGIHLWGNDRQTFHSRSCQFAFS